MLQQTDAPSKHLPNTHLRQVSLQLESPIAMVGGMSTGKMGDRVFIVRSTDSFISVSEACSYSIKIAVVGLVALYSQLL